MSITEGDTEVNVHNACETVDSLGNMINLLAVSLIALRPCISD